jgi:hypothetical protein
MLVQAFAMVIGSCIPSHLRTVAFTKAVLGLDDTPKERDGRRI